MGNNGVSPPLQVGETTPMWSRDAQDVYFLLCFSSPPPGLQSTRLGMYIEDRVNKYLKRQNHPEAGEVFVRVVASSDKMVEVKPGMKAR